MEEAIVIDTDDMTQFVVDQFKDRGIDISADTVNLVFDMETEYLRNKGLIYDGESIPSE